MAALVVLNSDLSKLTKTAIKKEIREMLSTISIYKLSERNATALNYAKSHKSCIITNRKNKNYV